MNKPFIYNRCIDENLVGTYCGLNLDGEFYTYGIYGRKPIWSVNEGITPATKEQRNMLFSKMKEAGYKWDSEKKQLITVFKPKFRIGDTIKKKSTGDIVTISMVDLKNGEYRLSNTGFIPFNYEHLWELVEIEQYKHDITIGTKIRSKANPDVILTIISDDCHVDEFECSNGSVLSLKQIEKYYERID